MLVNTFFNFGMSIIQFGMIVQGKDVNKVIFKDRNKNSCNQNQQQAHFGVFIVELNNIYPYGIEKYVFPVRYKAGEVIT